MVDRRKQCPVWASCPRVREQDAPTAVFRNKNNFGAYLRPLPRPLSCKERGEILPLSKLCFINIFLNIKRRHYRQIMVMSGSSFFLGQKCIENYIYLRTLSSFDYLPRLFIPSPLLPAPLFPTRFSEVPYQG